MTRLDDELRQLWSRFRPANGPTQNAASGTWDQDVGPSKSLTENDFQPLVPQFPPVPRVLHAAADAQHEPVLKDDAGDLEERAAILEFDGGLSRAEAEERALAEGAS